MPREIILELICYAVAALAGWLCRGGVNEIRQCHMDKRLKDEHAKGKASGYYECLVLSQPERTEKMRELRRVK